MARTRRADAGVGVELVEKHHQDVGVVAAMPKVHEGPQVAVSKRTQGAPHKVLWCHRRAVHLHTRDTSH